MAQFFEVVASELPESAMLPDESEVAASPHASVGGVIVIWSGPIIAYLITRRSGIVK